ncbi:hypothetical protein QR680_012521 [Steinernema hermaphroditum]|uniref:Uncharacterized protein n=1 Tax=Steinernema hermaphroditum TaxID=289476 RepID=A0AA39LZY7_9BILA|nr:hypothetical protein QR680_012521 [Steinernema hermaphroditum]
MCSYRCLAILFVVLSVVFHSLHLIEHSSNFGWSVQTATLPDIVRFCHLHLALVLGLLFGVLAIIGLMTERTCLLFPFLLCSILATMVFIWACVLEFPRVDFNDRSKAVDASILLLKTVVNSVASICLFLCFLEMRRFC